MTGHTWRYVDGVDAFLDRAGTFLHARPALHTVFLTVTEALRTRGPYVYGDEAPVFGVLEGEKGEVGAAFFRTPPQRLTLTPLTKEQAGTLARWFAGAGHPALPGVSADQATAAAFTEAWQHATGATAMLHQSKRLYRLGTLTPPRPAPPGRARIATARDRDHLARRHVEFAESVGAEPQRDPGAWVDARLAHDGLTLWETPDGTPVSLAGVTPRVAGQVRVAPVYTPAPLRGRGYAGAVTAEVSRVAQTGGAGEVLLFTDLANPTSNGLYQRIGYEPVRDFAVYDFEG
ncbi:GNAT family N-acetyltransferase [Streptomyces sp. NPDC002088]|uniref:GNAT family N-acetyltransferase n=1 Tax=Streptomyces sp. NPDC002088 TaxID=3154665 RepID=UPI003324EB54